jgi:hypothetical protein
MAKSRSATQLMDLDVDRVDGVDKPATGRSFLLFKGEDGDAILKGYGMVATAADAVLKSIRKDSKAVVSRKSAIALNGLAQVMGADAVFVGKSVPTQPYLFTEPDADKRGPADEDLGSNFTPRSMPGSMVGSVQFRMKDDEDDEDASKTAKSKAKAAYDEDEDDKKAKAAKASAKAKADGDGDADDDGMDGSERANRGVARTADIADLAKAIAKGFADLPGAIVAAEKAAIAKMQGGEPEAEVEAAKPVRKASRQIDADDVVRKSADTFAPRLGVSFADVVFKGNR